MIDSKESKNKLSLIVYGDSQTPHYFQLNRGLIRFLVTAFPIISFISLGVVTTGVIYFKNIRTIAEKKEPAIIAELRTEKETLAQKLKESKDLSASLEKKLLSGGSEKLSSLSLFKQSVGGQDLSGSPALSLDEIELVTLKDKLFLQFNIVNNSAQNIKLAGFVFVLMKMGNALYLYPNDALPENEIQVAFTSGESFATYRFRPVNANFPKEAVKKGQALFRVFIFSRSGDLLHKQTVSKEIRF